MKPSSRTRRAYASATALVLCLAPLAHANWPMAMHDARRSGSCAERPELPFAPLWTHESRLAPAPAWPPPAKGSYWQNVWGILPRLVHDHVFAPVSDGERAFFASSANDSVVALDLGRGTVLWRRILGAPIRFAPLLLDGRVHVAGDDGIVSCLGARDGALLWERRLAPEIRRIPGNGRLVSVWPCRTGLVSVGSRLYATAGLFPAQGCDVFELDARTGDVIWRTRLDGQSPQGYLLASSQHLYVPTGRAAPILLEREGGRVRGGVKKAPPGSWALITEKGELVSGPGDRGELQLSSTSTRERIARFRGRRLVGDASLTFILGESTIRALARGEPSQAREVIWEQRTEASDALILARDTLFLGGKDRIDARTVADGELIWTAPTSGRALSLAFSRGTLLVATDRGVLHAFGPAKREIGARQRPAGRATPMESHPSTERDRAEAHVESLLDSIAETLPGRGWALVLEADSGALVRALLSRGELRVVALTRTREARDRLRRELDSDRLYGTRASVHLETDVSLPSWFANLVTSEREWVEGTALRPGEEIARLLRPHGGMLVTRSPLEGWSNLVDGPLARHGESTLVRGALPGEGEWTHLYADAGNSASSGDERVAGDLDLQWFGAPGPRPMLDRHLRTTAPLARAGRLIVPAHDRIIAVDAYNGTPLWEAELPGFSRVAVPFESGHMALGESRLHVAAGESLIVLDVESGEPRARRSLPEEDRVARRHWGWVALEGERILASAQVAAASRRERSRGDIDRQYRGEERSILARSIFATTLEGSPTWREAGLFLATSLAAADGRVLAITAADETTSSASDEGRVRLERFFARGTRLVSRDAADGALLWQREFAPTDLRHIAHVIASPERVLVAGSASRGDEIVYVIRAFASESGAPLWEARHAHTRRGTNLNHGEQVQHPVLRANTLFAEPFLHDLESGERIAPDGNPETSWRLPARSGCGSFSGSQSTLFFRDSHPTAIDLVPDGVRRKLTRASRPGCWISIVPACGLVLLPEASSGCVCAFSIQTSLALAPRGAR